MSCCLVCWLCPSVDLFIQVLLRHVREAVGCGEKGRLLFRVAWRHQEIDRKQNCESPTRNGGCIEPAQRNSQSVNPAAPTC